MSRSRSQSVNAALRSPASAAARRSSPGPVTGWVSRVPSAAAGDRRRWRNRPGSPPVAATGGRSHAAGGRRARGGRGPRIASRADGSAGEPWSGYRASSSAASAPGARSVSSASESLFGCARACRRDSRLLGAKRSDPLQDRLALLVLALVGLDGRPIARRQRAEPADDLLGCERVVAGGSRGRHDVRRQPERRPASCPSGVRRALRRSPAALARDVRPRRAVLRALVAGLRDSSRVALSASRTVSAAPVVVTSKACSP